MKVRCTSIVDKEVWSASTDAMNWLSGLLEPALADEAFGDGVDQFMVVAIGVNEDAADDEKVVRSNTGCTRYKDQFTGQQVRLLSVGLPIGYQRMRAFDRGNLRRFIVATLLEKLDATPFRIPKEFDYGGFVSRVRDAVKKSAQ